MSGPEQSRLTRRRLLAGGLSASVAVLLAACASPSTPAATPTTAPKAAAPTSQPATTAAPQATTPTAQSQATPVPKATTAPAATAAPQQAGGTVELWSRETWANGSREPLIKQHLVDFTKSTGITANVQFLVYQESIQKEQAAVAAGTPPEVAQQGPDVNLSFAAAGYLAPLDDAMKEIGSDNFLQLQKDAYVLWHGKTYGIPWYIETRILFYHKDLLDAAGVKPPNLWSEWADAAKKLTTSNQYGFMNPFDGPGPGQFWIPLGQTVGGVLIDKDGKVTANNAQMKQGLQFASDLYLKYETMPKAALTYKSTDEEQLFLLKKVAILYGNGQILDDVTTQKPELLPNLGAVLMPVQAEGQTSRSFLGGFGLFNFQKAKNLDGGLQLLKWMYQEPWYSSYMQSAGGADLPVTKAAANSDFFQKSEILKLLITQEQNAVRYGGPIYGNAPFDGEAEGKLLFSQPLVDVDAGKATVEAALQKLQSQLESLAANSPK